MQFVDESWPGRQSTQLVAMSKPCRHLPQFNNGLYPGRHLVQLETGSRLSSTQIGCPSLSQVYMPCNGMHSVLQSGPK